MPPWNDYAIAIERRRGSPVVICEGTLAAVITAMTSLDRARLHGIRVALTDRGARPYTFEHDELDRVMMDQKRPTTTAAMLLPERALS